MAKCGGTYIEAVLKQVIPKDLLTIQNETLSLVPNVAEGHFVLGSVRNPCEYYPSLWAHSMSQFCMENLNGCYIRNVPEEMKSQMLSSHLGDPPYEDPEDVQSFRTFVNYTFAEDMGVMSLRFWSGYVRNRKEEGCHKRSAINTIPAEYVDQEMTPAEREAALEELDAYDPLNSAVSCWTKLESLEQDLLACLKLYAAKGGTVLWEKVPGVMAETAWNDSEHADCPVYYDAATEALVRHGDAWIFDKFGYTSCCGAS